MKLLFDYFSSMTVGTTLGRRIYTRYGILKIDTYSRLIQGFVPWYASLADENVDPNLKAVANPAYPLKLAPGPKVVRAKNAAVPVVIIPNENGAQPGNAIYSTDLWHFFVDDPTETDLGIPNGTPATNQGIDAAIFNSEIFTTHPLDGDIYHGAISASPSWAGVTASMQAVVHPMKVIAGALYVLDSSQGSNEPRDTIQIVTWDGSAYAVETNLFVNTHDYDMVDIEDYVGQNALLFAVKTVSSSQTPSLQKATIAFLWNLVAGDSYTQAYELPGLYRCSIVDNGVVYAFTQIGPTLACYAFTGTGFKEIGTLKNIRALESQIPKRIIGVEGDFFVILTDKGVLYWSPASGAAFLIATQVEGVLFTSLLVALSPTTSHYARYLAYQDPNNDDIGTLYRLTMEDTTAVEYVSNLYDDTHQTGNYVLPGGSDDASRVAQSFVAKGGYLLSASFMLKSEGAPTGNMVAKLYANSGSLPDTSALAESDPIGIATLTSDFQDIKFTFSSSNRVKLTASTTYWVSFEYASGNPTNRPDIGSDSATAGAGPAAIFASSAWSSTSGSAIFQVVETRPTIGTYSTNVIPAPLTKEAGDDPLGRTRIERLQLIYNQAPPTQNDAFAVTLTTKDQYESDDVTAQTATIADTTAHSTDASVDPTRAIMHVGDDATEFSIDLTVTADSPDWSPIVRAIVVVHDPIALQQ